MLAVLFKFQSVFQNFFILIGKIISATTFFAFKLNAIFSFFRHNKLLKINFDGQSRIFTPHLPIVGGLGFEPRKAEPADLQSAPFDHFGTHPKN